MYRICSCGALAPQRGPCLSCSRGGRPTAAQRGYGAKWRRGPRARQLRSQPFCQWTEADGSVCGKLATDVDHIQRRRLGGSDSPANLQSLCHAHHSVKTANEVNADRATRQQPLR